MSRPTTAVLLEITFALSLVVTPPCLADGTPDFVFDGYCDDPLVGGNGNNSEGWLFVCFNADTRLWHNNWGDSNADPALLQFPEPGDNILIPAPWSVFGVPNHAFNCIVAPIGAELVGGTLNTTSLDVGYARPNGGTWNAGLFNLGVLDFDSGTVNSANPVIANEVRFTDGGNSMLNVPELCANTWLWPAVTGAVEVAPNTLLRVKQSLTMSGDAIMNGDPSSTLLIEPTASVFVTGDHLVDMFFHFQGLQFECAPGAEVDFLSGLSEPPDAPWLVDGIVRMQNFEMHTNTTGNGWVVLTAVAGLHNTTHSGLRVLANGQATIDGLVQVTDSFESYGGIVRGTDRNTDTLDCLGSFTLRGSDLSHEIRDCTGNMLDGAWESGQTFIVRDADMDIRGPFDVLGASDRTLFNTNGGRTFVRDGGTLNAILDPGFDFTLSGNGQVENQAGGTAVFDCDVDTGLNHYIANPGSTTRTGVNGDVSIQGGTQAGDWEIDGAFDFSSGVFLDADLSIGATGSAALQDVSVSGGTIANIGAMTVSDVSILDAATYVDDINAQLNAVAGETTIGGAFQSNGTIEGRGTGTVLNFGSADGNDFVTLAGECAMTIIDEALANINTGSAVSTDSVMVSDADLNINDAATLDARIMQIAATESAKLDVQDGGGMSVDDFLTKLFDGSGHVLLHYHGSGGLASSSATPSMTVRGKFRFDLVDETDWTWDPGTVLALTGGVGATPADWSDWTRLEIGGTDLGTDPSTHSGDPAGFDNNFDLSILRIGPGAHALLEDRIDNGNRNGAGGAAEALYVDTLEFADGSGVLNLNELHLYYGTLIGDPLQIIDQRVCAADLDGDGGIGVTDLLFLLAKWGESDADINGDNTTGVVDVLALLSAWGPC